VVRLFYIEDARFLNVNLQTCRFNKTTEKKSPKKSQYNFAQGLHATISITTFLSKDLYSAVLLDRQLQYCHSNTINHGAAPRVLQRSFINMH
jgi:hypothetical protein